MSTHPPCTDSEQCRIGDHLRVQPSIKSFPPLCCSSRNDLCIVPVTMQELQLVHLQEFLHHVRLRHAQVLSDANSAKRDQPLALVKFLLGNGNLPAFPKSQGRVVLVYKGCSTLFISLILPQYPIRSGTQYCANHHLYCKLTQSLTMGTPKEKFDAAVGVIRSLPKEGAFKPSNELLLRLYSLYKQATEGPCRQPRPGFWIRQSLQRTMMRQQRCCCFAANGVSGGGVEERSEADEESNSNTWLQLRSSCRKTVLDCSTASSCFWNSQTDGSLHHQSGMRSNHSSPRPWCVVNSQTTNSEVSGWDKLFDFCPATNLPCVSVPACQSCIGLVANGKFSSSFLLQALLRLFWLNKTDFLRSGSLSC
uniref:ACB domain-containing protein n=1 Tax=Macrostomum lignano TaxID=282301 RepID=A0A1I8FP52_9PLAT